MSLRDHQTVMDKPTQCMNSGKLEGRSQTAQNSKVRMSNIDDPVVHLGRNLRIARYLSVVLRLGVFQCGVCVVLTCPCDVH